MLRACGCQAVARGRVRECQRPFRFPKVNVDAINADGGDLLSLTVLNAVCALGREAELKARSEVLIAIR